MENQRVIAPKTHIINNLRLQEDFELAADFSIWMQLRRVQAIIPITLDLYVKVKKILSPLTRERQDQISYTMIKMSTLVPLHCKRINFTNG